jgi:hypothetical protein
LDSTEKLDGDTLTTVDFFRETCAARMLPAELALLAKYCALPANDAEIVTVVFCWTEGAI